MLLLALLPRLRGSATSCGSSTLSYGRATASTAAHALSYRFSRVVSIRLMLFLRCTCLFCDLIFPYSLEAQCKRWALAGAEASAAAQAHAAMADRCSELEQQKVALSELLSNERAAAAAVSASASAAAATLQAEIAELRQQVHVTAAGSSRLRPSYHA